jgi:hypothetical protein
MREDTLGWGFVEVALQNGQWEPIDGHGGTGCPLRVQPPDGMSMASWSLDDSDPRSPASTELQLNVTTYHRACEQPVLTADDVAAGVVETRDEITIRVAIDRPPLSEREAIEQMMTCEDPLDERPVTIVVPLQEPLGHRRILDGDIFPPREQPAEMAPDDSVVPDQSTPRECGATDKGAPPPAPATFEVAGPSGPLSADGHVPAPSGGAPLTLRVHMSLTGGTTLDHLALLIEGEGEAVSEMTPATPIAAGEHDFEVVWDGFDLSGNAVPPGSYRLAVAYTVGQDERDPCSSGAGGNWKRGLGWLDVTE